jgi:uncharacterized coiled-coil DUF342 family protein
MLTYFELAMMLFWFANLVVAIVTLIQGVKIMATQAEAIAELQALKDQLVKANTEIQNKIQTLVDAANNAGNVSPELQAAIDDLKPAAQALDDIVPDAPPAA